MKSELKTYTYLRKEGYTHREAIQTIQKEKKTPYKPSTPNKKLKRS